MLSYIAIARASCALRLVRLARLDDCCIWFEMQSKCQTCGVLVSSIKKSRLEVHRNGQCQPQERVDITTVTSQCDSTTTGEPPIGCSLFIYVQNYTSQGNEGIPKSIRGNITCCAMWKSGNVKELDLWATELSGIIPKDDILEAYDFVMTRDPYNRHNFLFVDLNPKLDHPSPFRMNYDSWLIS